MRDFRYVSCCAGGHHCTAFFGVVQALERHTNFRAQLKTVKGVAGSSAGCLVALCLYFDMSVDTLFHILLPIISNFESTLQNLDVALLFSKFGLDNGELLRSKIKKIFSHNGLSGDITFAALKNFYNKDFVVVATNLQQKRAVYFSATSHPTMKVVNAIAMSMCVPFVFAPYEFDGDLYVDAALSHSLPICFPAQETLCFKLARADPSEIRTFQEYLFTIVMCGKNCHELTETVYASQSQCIMVSVPPLLSKVPIQRNLHETLIQQYISCGFASGLMAVFPQFGTAFDLLIHVMLTFYVGEFDVDG